MVTKVICPYVFCPQCKSRESWVREPKRDIYTVETHELVWRGWRCRICGDSTIEPVLAELGLKEAEHDK